MKRHFFLIFLFLLITRICASAYPNMIVEHYTAERGLPNNIVNCTLKGQDGFVWFGTWYGLCSFDGTKFRSYDNHDGFYSADIPPRKIQRIVEDRNGFLWIKTIDRKLYLFDKKHESFHAVYDDVKEYSENIQIIKIQTTEDGDVLLLTKDKSLLRANTDSNGKITMKQLHDSRPNVKINLSTLFRKKYLPTRISSLVLRTVPNFCGWEIRTGVFIVSIHKMESSTATKYRISNSRFPIYWSQNRD